MNKVILLGNVGRDPRMRMADTSRVAEFPLATSERRTTRDAEGREINMPELTEWHNIVMWGRAAEFAEKYIRKGSKLLVEGKLRTRAWDGNSKLTKLYFEAKNKLK